MQTHIFHVWSMWSAVPFTILAADERRASALFMQWCKAHAPTLLEQPGKVEQASYFLTEDHPMLGAAAKEGKEGIAYYLGDVKGWTIAPPRKRQPGLLAPVEPSVRVYKINVHDGEDTWVFATSGADAILLFMRYHQQAYGHRPDHFECVEDTIWSLQSDKASLRQDMLAGHMGVAGQDEEGAWRVYPEDHPRAGNANPFI